MGTFSFKALFKPNVGWLAVVAAIGLTVIGLEAIDTAPKKAALASAAKKQAVFLVIACGVMLFTAAFHHKGIARLAVPISGAVVFLLLILLVPGMPEGLIPVRNGARRWINMHFMYLQPSELAKIVFVIALAAFLRTRQNYRTIPGLVLPFTIMLVPMGLVLIEPDLGTSLIFPPVLFAMLIAAGAKIKHLLAIVMMGVLTVGSVLYVELWAFEHKQVILRPHQKARLLDVKARLTGDTRHEQGISFQGKAASTLVGAGRAWGHDRQVAHDLARYNRLPEAHNDMVFSMICLRHGAIGGGMLVLGLYCALIFSAMLAAVKNGDPFARLVVVGVATIIFTQVFVNIGMTVGLLPITGMTLPFISYGGSSLVANFVMVGLIWNVAAHPVTRMGKPAFEYDNARKGR